MDVPISDPLIKNIKGGEEFQKSRMYNPVGVAD